MLLFLLCFFILVFGFVFSFVGSICEECEQVVLLLFVDDFEVVCWVVWDIGKICWQVVCFFEEFCEVVGLLFFV